MSCTLAASITGGCVQVASLLSSELGIALPSTAAFDYPTVDAMTRFVLDLPLQVCAVTCSLGHLDCSRIIFGLMRRRQQ